ncbi:MAG: D-glycero-alpha-D-manno-heptose 7-phosphate kinase [Verrucomicrobiae bacterium]|nr:D-glycero-alpha-D-manno-heptose 7-phosphate kinase [Verrucomicrobiae bacterium]
MIITQTPLRISFAGGGTDLPDFYEQHGGAVCSSAIDKFVYCIVKERFDDKIYVNWSKKEIVDSVDQIEHDLVREAMRKVGVTKGIEISFLSDIPSEGSGLGSSSTVTVGVLHALYAFIGETPTAERLASEACDIEIRQLGKPIGVQDQYIAAYGGLRYFQFGPGKDIKSNAVSLARGTLEDLDNILMLFFTGKTRKADNILSKQKANVVSKADTLKLMTQQANEVRQLLETGDVTALGALLHRGWEAKRKMTDGSASASDLDEVYERALKAGCLGGKIAGAGGGGFFLLVVPSDKRQAVRQALANLKEMPFRLERGGSRVALNMQRY